MDRSSLLMLSAVVATCTDCGEKTVFVPSDDTDAGAAVGEFCCTGCDAAVFLLSPAGSTAEGDTHQVA